MEQLTYSTPVDEELDKSFFLESLPSVESWPERWEIPSKHFGLFLAADTRGLPDDKIAAIARQMLMQGVVYVCAWGPDSRRIEDVFDSARDENETDETVIMTTSHPNERLRDALFYFAFCAFPAAAYERTCSAWVAVALGNEEWATEIREYLIGVHGKTKEG